jgi:hypothetical protein
MTQYVICEELHFKILFRSESDSKGLMIRSKAYADLRTKQNRNILCEYSVAADRHRTTVSYIKGTKVDVVKLVCVQFECWWTDCSDINVWVAGKRGNATTVLVLYTARTSILFVSFKVTTNRFSVPRQTDRRISYLERFVCTTGLLITFNQLSGIFSLFLSIRSGDIKIPRTFIFVTPPFYTCWPLFKIQYLNHMSL